jgi:hypothetical protein
MALDQGQDPAADRAEPDHHDRALEQRMQRLAFGHTGDCVHIGCSCGKASQSTF